MRRRLLAQTALLLRPPRERRELRRLLAGTVCRARRRRSRRTRPRLRALRAPEPGRAGRCGRRHQGVRRRDGRKEPLPLRGDPPEQPGTGREHVRGAPPDPETDRLRLAIRRRERDVHGLRQHCVPPGSSSGRRADLVLRSPHVAWRRSPLADEERDPRARFRSLPRARRPAGARQADADPGGGYHPRACLRVARSNRASATGCRLSARKPGGAGLGPLLSAEANPAARAGHA
jgi:hypothetical protein